MAISDLRWVMMGDVKQLQYASKGAWGWRAVPEETLPTPPPDEPPAGDDQFDLNWILDRVVRHALERIPNKDKGSGQQAAFLSCWDVLGLYINGSGTHYCTAGDLYRDPRSHGAYGKVAYDSEGQRIYGRATSNHKLRLAGDLNLFEFVNGKWDFVRTSEGHRPFGVWWEDLGREVGLPLRSGIRYDDGNHYELVPGWEWEPMG